ncbi:MAG: hypothetical protein MUE73_08900, partial [Planctomycetes bacterium]|nr:hypothetical protein [Planctomycetota bacterium]
MRIGGVIAAAFVAALALARPVPPARGAPEVLDLPLFVEEPGAADRLGEGVRAGVPLPASAGVFDASRLFLLGRGPSGAFDRQVPLSAQTTSRWGGRPGDRHCPARWVLLDFPATVARSGRTEFRLRYDRDDSREGGSGREIAGAALVAEDDRRILVDTGRIRFQVTKDRFGLFEAAEFEGSGSGDLAGPPFDICIVDGDGIEYRASRAVPVEVAVEESVPLAAVIVVRGRFRDEEGRELLGGFAAYTLRLHLFAGSPEVRLVFTLENNGFYGREAEWSASGGVSRWLSFTRLELVLRTGLTGVVRADIEKGFEDVALTTGGFRLRQEHRIERVPDDLDDESRNFVFTVETGRGEPFRGSRSRGAFRVSRGERAVSVAVRHFFENWPAALGFRDGSIRFEPWPAEGRWPPGTGDGPYVFEGGRWKTNEFVVDFAGGDPAVLARRIARPLFARASAEWCAASGALGPMAPLSFPIANSASARALGRLNRLQAVVVDVSEADPQPLGVAEPAIPPISLLTQRESRGNAFKPAPYDVDLYGSMNFGD